MPATLGSDPMSDLVRSPVIALLWGIWLRNRASVCWLLCLTIGVCVVNLAAGDTLRAEQSNRFVSGLPLALGLLNWNALGAAFLLVFAIFGYDEFNAQKST